MTDDSEPIDLQPPPPLTMKVTQRRRWGPGAWEGRLSDHLERGWAHGWTRAAVIRRLDRKARRIKREEGLQAQSQETYEWRPIQ